MNDPAMETNMAEKIALEYAPLPAHFTPGGPSSCRNRKGRTTSPLHWLSLPSAPTNFPHSFEATTGTRAAARRNQVTVGVEDFKRNCVGELVRVATELDGTREPVCLYPGSGGTKNEGLGHCAVRVAVCVPP